MPARRLNFATAEINEACSARARRLLRALDERVSIQPLTKGSVASDRDHNEAVEVEAAYYELRLVEMKVHVAEMLW